MMPLRSLADCYEILLANMVRVDLNPRAHGAGYGDALHVDTFCAGWLCFDEGLCQCVVNIIPSGMDIIRETAISDLKICICMLYGVTVYSICKIPVHLRTGSIFLP